MATYYIDKSAVENGDGSLLSPYNQLPTLTANNIYLFKGNVDIGEQITLNTDNITIGSYSGKAIINCNNTINYGVYGTGISNITIQDLIIDGANKTGILIENDSAGTTKTNIKILRCRVQNILPGNLVRNTEADIRVGSGIVVGSGPTTGLALISGILIADCVVHTCGAHGIDVRWRALNVIRRNCTVYNTGLQIGSHGITAHPIATTITSGWSLETGNIYSRARVSINDAEQILINSTDVVFLTKVAGTSPNSGEWSVDATKIYVNVGETPVGKSFYLKRHAHGPFLDTDHLVYNIKDYDGNEGHGIDTDDGTGPTTIRRCVSIGNEGAGFYSYRGESVVIENCLSKQNKKSGFGLLLINAPKIYNCSSILNNIRGVQIDGGLNGEVKNCLAISNGTSGIATTGTGFYVASTHSNLTSASNFVYNNFGTTEVFGTGMEATVETTTPINNQDMLITNKIGIYTNNGVDLNRKFKNNPPSIGAYEYVSERAGR